MSEGLKNIRKNVLTCRIQFVHVAHILIHVKWFDLLHFVDKYDTSTVRRKAPLSSGVSVTLIYSYPAHVGPRKARAQLITYGALSARLPCWMSYRRVPFFSRCCLFSFSFFPLPSFFFCSLVSTHSRALRSRHLRDTVPRPGWFRAHLPAINLGQF